jgi:bacillithiol biosynthesis cysteine-adding enzyme BshC
MGRDWYTVRPTGAAEWSARARDVLASTPDGWLDALRPAMSASGHAAARLELIKQGRGVVVTTGQQPGLFGGPIYTWSKALSAIALAELLEQSIGMPVVPVFWAATDDSDIAEASWTMVSRAGGVDELRLGGGSDGVSMADVPLGDTSELLERFERAAGSASWPAPLELVRRAYRPGTTIGGAYLELLRGMLEPLGMPVLDAAHPAVRAAGSPLLRDALRQSERIADALAQRDRELREAGHTPQVASVPGLSLVFRTDTASRQRVKHGDAAAVAGTAGDAALSPNVLLRPVVERAILPTVAYVAGPAELGYFAQVSAVSTALNASSPLAVPRWSCTILEPHVEAVLAELHIDPRELQDPHAVETRVARERLPDGVASAFARANAAVSDALSSLEQSAAALVSSRAIEGARRAIGARIARLERRYTAAMKRQLADVLRDVATARGSLYPNGKRQERALNLIPLLARSGRPLLDAMLAAARTHARGIVDADAVAVATRDRAGERAGTPR